jgi:hypothetical protein
MNQHLETQNKQGTKIIRQFIGRLFLELRYRHKFAEHTRTFTTAPPHNTALLGPP